MPKQLPSDYVPTVPPINFEDWHRWIDDELFRISNAFKAEPVAFGVKGNGSMAVSSSPNTVVIGIGDLPVLDSPEGNWDSATGIWTCPLNGIYNMSANITMLPFGSGNKNYAIKIELLVDDVPRASQSNGGSDDIELGVAFSQPAVFFKGEQIKMTLTAQHEQFTGTGNYDYSFSYLRNK